MKRSPHCAPPRQSPPRAMQTAPEPPRVQRYEHPIENRPAPSCALQQQTLCALRTQNRLLCAMKAELDEILSLLQERQQ